MVIILKIIIYLKIIQFVCKREIYNIIYDINNITQDTIEFALPINSTPQPYINNITTNKENNLFRVINATGIFREYDSGYVRIDYTNNNVFQRKLTFISINSKNLIKHNYLL